MSADLLSVTVHVTNTFACAHLAYLPTIVRQGDFRNQHRNYCGDYPMVRVFLLDCLSR